jgi:hypothetical protein
VLKGKKVWVDWVNRKCVPGLQLSCGYDALGLLCRFVLALRLHCLSLNSIHNIQCECRNLL